MSYLVTIRRPDDRPILEGELRELAASDEELEVSAAGEELLLRWRQPGEQPFVFLVTEGRIDTTTTPSNAAVRKMQGVARSLGARVIDEDDQDLTDIDVPLTETAGAVTLGCYIIAAALVALIAWWIFLT